MQCDPAGHFTSPPAGGIMKPCLITRYHTSQKESKTYLILRSRSGELSSSSLRPSATIFSVPCRLKNFEALVVEFLFEDGKARLARYR